MKSLTSLINPRWHEENKDFLIESSTEKIRLTVRAYISNDHFHILACLTAYPERGTFIIFDTRTHPDHSEVYKDGKREFNTAFGEHVTEMTYEEWFLAAQDRLLEYYDLKKKNWDNITHKAKEDIIVSGNFSSGIPSKILKSWKDKVTKHPEKYQLNFRKDFDQLYELIKNETPEDIEHMPLSYETLKQAWNYFNK